jgi:hypothetical protein
MHTKKIANQAPKIKRIASSKQRDQVESFRKGISIE